MTVAKLTLAFSALIAILGSACSSTGEKSDDGMDINLRKQAAHQAVDPKAPAPVGTPTTGLTIPADAVIKWEQFFKSPPTPEERGLLAQSLKAPAESASLAELVKRGRNAVALGQLAAAEAAFKQALRQDDGNVGVLQELAQFYLRKREVSKAFDFLTQLRQRLEEIPAKNPLELFRYRYTLAIAYIARGETAKGHRILSDLIAIDKAFTPGYAALASSYLSLGKFNVAEFISKRGLDRGKEDAALYNVLGIVAQRSNDRTAALDYFNKALKVSPTYAPAIVNRANAMIETKELDVAESDLKQALVYAPGSVDAYVSLGICQKKMGRFQAAETSFTRAMELDPENAAARFNLGILMADQMKKPNVALRLFNEVLQTEDKNTEIKQMARLYIDDIRDNRQ